MKKYVIGIFALALALGFTAFTHIPKSPKPTVTDYYYQFSGMQTQLDRKTSTKYINPTTTAPNGITCPSGSVNQCYLHVQLTGTAPTNPNFSGWTFDANGFPLTGTGFSSNIKKP